MHIQPYHKKPGWQRFFAGAFFGGLIAYAVFMYMHGVMQERLLEENLTLQAETGELRRQNEALLRDNKDLGEKTKEGMTIETIEIEILNEKQMRMDRLITHQIEELMKEEIGQIVGESIESVAENDQLLISTIENETYKIDDFSYKLEIEKLVISKTVRITAKAEFAK